MSARNYLYTVDTCPARNLGHGELDHPCEGCGYTEVPEYPQVRRTLWNRIIRRKPDA